MWPPAPRPACGPGQRAARPWTPRAGAPVGRLASGIRNGLCREPQFKATRRDLQGGWGVHTEDGGADQGRADFFEIGVGRRGWPVPSGTQPLKACSTVGLEIRSSHTFLATLSIAERCRFRRCSTTPAASRAARWASASCRPRRLPYSLTDLVRDHCRTNSPRTAAWSSRIAERSVSARQRSAPTRTAEPNKWPARPPSRVPSPKRGGYPDGKECPDPHLQGPDPKYPGPRAVIFPRDSSEGAAPGWYVRRSVGLEGPPTAVDPCQPHVGVDLWRTLTRRW